MKQLLIGAALVATAACAAVGAAAAVAAPVGSSSDASIRTLTLVVKATSFKLVDHPPKNVFGPGDYVVDTTDVTGARDAERIGTGTGYCIQQSKAGATPVILFCTATISLAAGQIVLAGAVVDEAERSVVAVVGGTGSFRGARGQAVETPLDDESSRWKLTFEAR